MVDQSKSGPPNLQFIIPKLILPKYNLQLFPKSVTSKLSDIECKVKKIISKQWYCEVGN